MVSSKECSGETSFAFRQHTLPKPLINTNKQFPHGPGVLWKQVLQDHHGLARRVSLRDRNRLETALEAADSALMATRLKNRAGHLREQNSEAHRLEACLEARHPA
jgi:hypothetical protein